MSKPLSKAPGFTRFPRDGVKRGASRKGIGVVNLHYNCDPEKGGGKKVYSAVVERELSPWALAQLKSMTPSLYLREIEIDAEATLGSLIYLLHQEVTVCPAFPIPPEWTRYVALDPHPAVPHFWLWCAVDPYGDRWYYREMWPSTAAYHYERGVLVGEPGGSPQDDNRVRIEEYVQTLKYLESADNPENGKHDEKIAKRVIDFAARAFGKGTSDDPEQPNFQMRYEHFLRLHGLERPYFEDAKKDHAVGEEVVNQGLRVIERMGNDGNFHPHTPIHIFGDRCPELIYQLKNHRRKQLTPTQLEEQDPTGRALDVRCHGADCIRYLEMARPMYVGPPTKHKQYQPPHEGISY